MTRSQKSVTVWGDGGVAVGDEARAARRSGTPSTPAVSARSRQTRAAVRTGPGSRVQTASNSRSRSGCRGWPGGSQALSTAAKAGRVADHGPLLAQRVASRERDEHRVRPATRRGREAVREVRDRHRAPGPPRDVAPARLGLGVVALRLERAEGEALLAPGAHLVLDRVRERDERRLAQALAREARVGGADGGEHRGLVGPAQGADGRDRAVQAQPALLPRQHLADRLDVGVAVASVPARQPGRLGEPEPLLPHPQQPRADTGALGHLADGQGGPACSSLRLLLRHRDRHSATITYTDCAGTVLRPGTRGGTLTAEASWWQRFELGRFVRAALVDKVPRDHVETEAAFRRRRTVVGLTLLVGALLLGVSLRLEPGDDRFYVLTLLLAATWVVGTLVAGPVHLGWAHTRSADAPRPADRAARRPRAARGRGLRGRGAGRRAGAAPARPGRRRAGPRQLRLAARGRRASPWSTGWPRSCSSAGRSSRRCGAGRCSGRRCSTRWPRSRPAT